MSSDSNRAKIRKDEIKMSYEAPKDVAIYREEMLESNVSDKLRDNL